MIRLDDFDKVRKYVKKWAKEKGIEVAYVSVDDEELTFYEENRDCTTTTICTYYIKDLELESAHGDTIADLFDM